MAKKKKEKKKPEGKKAPILLLVVFSLVMVVVFQLGFIFFLMSMLPTVVAYYVDNSRHQSTFHTVFACNLAGVLPYLAKMLTEDTPGSATSLIMTDASSWLIVYAGAGLGWVLVFAMPIAAEFFIRNLHRRQVLRLERMQARITEEWGETVGEIQVPASLRKK